MQGTEIRRIATAYLVPRHLELGRDRTNSNKRTPTEVRMGRKVIVEERVEGELRQLSSSPADKIGLLIGQVRQ